MHPPVLLLDRNWFPISVIPWRRAVNLLLREVAEPIKWLSDRVSDWAVSVVRLTKRSVPPNHRRRTRVTKARIFERDAYTCGYCGKVGKKGLTLDHIVPKSRGGTNDPSNLVAACMPCNNWKGARLPAEAGMRLLYQPKTTKLEPIPGLLANTEEWQEFLGVYEVRVAA